MKLRNMTRYKGVYLNVVGQNQSLEFCFTWKARSCGVLETGPVSPFLVCVFKLAAKKPVFFNRYDLCE